MATPRRTSWAAAWARVHRWPRWARWLLKTFVFAVIVALVLYPKVWLLPTWITRLQNLNSVLQPDYPDLATLERLVRARVADDRSWKALRAAVERTVCEQIPYAFDWDTWGVMDYLPTVAEVFAKGREDCDGRAVVAASLLRRMGYQAWLATDLKHMWVVTPEGDLMAPGEGDKTLAAGETGTRARLSPETVANLGRALAYGVGVFPLGRELIIALALWAVALHPGLSGRRRILGCLLLGGALAMLRLSGPAAQGLAEMPGLVWGGAAAGVAGWLMLVLRAGGRRCVATPPE